ncbi:class I SAM-dependent DNA methyltransferase [Pelosinus propionicus]|uniref:Ubiquinone/menaquinone biosynthesis C-methylase UbiE n=1 Tax=Pelosinus propionicus DSM 13327 TaxID=1123291 RepID=A0A1I4NKW0_9FIRM|nr:class I SAM-dependent methyltransferase [Pelosinus propionicus]SFM16015.1 Ubiquinone/menaquinone biosynthesis C-methylase UbiE [Pelosinus propionicus DSM 13327]
MNFDMRSTSWDTEKRVKRAEVIAKQIAHTVKLKKSYSALEFGCGTGLISFQLYDKLKDITCIDTSQGMIEALNAKIQQNKAVNITAYLHNIDDSHQLTPTYDLIYTSMALHHITDIDTTLANLYKLLKADGQLCIVDLDEDDGSFHKLEPDFTGHHGFNQSRLKEILGQIGFKEAASHTFYKDVKNINGDEFQYSLFIAMGRK